MTSTTTTEPETTTTTEPETTTTDSTTTTEPKTTTPLDYYDHRARDHHHRFDDH